MIKDILGILSDMIGIVFVWWQPDLLAWYWKVLISIALLGIATVFSFLTKNRLVEKVTNYSWEENKPLMLFLHKNPYYSTGMLVSIYLKDEDSKILCAIGHINTDPDGKRVHVQVLHQIDARAMNKIRSSRKKYKYFFVTPSVTQKDIMGIDWK